MGAWNYMIEPGVLGACPLGVQALRGREGVTLAIPQNDTVGMISPGQKILKTGVS